MQRTHLLVPVLVLLACGGDEPAATAPAPTAEPPVQAAPADAAPEAPASTDAAPNATAEGAAPPVIDPHAPSPGTEGELVEISAPEGTPEDIDLPSFATLIGDGPSVTLTVTLVGGDRGELTFQSIDEGVPEMLHVEIVEGASQVEVQAPVSYERPIYVAFSAAMDPTAGLESEQGRAAGTPGRDLPMQVGGAAEPVTLAGKDQEIQVTVGEVPDWLALLNRQSVVPFGGQAPGAPAQGG